MVNAGKNPFGASGAFGNVLPIDSLLPPGSREHRKETRYKATWKIAVVVDGHDLHDGKIKDISLHGAAIIIGHNLKRRASVTLHIHIPSVDGPAAPKILIVHGTAVYTVHDANDQCFRVGIAFDKFEVASDRAYLEARLASHHMKIL